MADYAYRAIDAKSNAICVFAVSNDVEEVLLHARKRMHNLVMLYRMTSAEKPRYDPLIRSANFPLPKELSSKRFIHLALDKKLQKELRANIRNGNIEGRAGYFSTTINLRSLLTVATKVLLPYLFGEAFLKWGATMGGYSEKRSGSFASPSESDEVREITKSEEYLPRLDARRNRMLDFLDNVIWLAVMGKEKMFTSPVLTFAHIVIHGRLADGAQRIHLRIGPTSSHVEWLDRHGAKNVFAVPQGMYEPMLVCLAAAVGIEPMTLPPATGEKELIVGNQSYVISGKTSMTDLGEELELCWHRMKGETGQSCAVEERVRQRFVMGSSPDSSRHGGTR